jgi:Protein of unknown function (DUF3300)
MNFSRCVAVFVVATMAAVAVPAMAQNAPPSALTPPPNTAAPAAAPLSQDLLDSLLAPIALYPDQLLSQVLMASTYPLEVVEAARFVKANPDIKGPALDNALKDKPWDASVLSLASFPQVLDMMNEQLDWTQRLGDAFLNDEAGVMQTVQGLRVRAQQAGNLQTTEQQQVIVQEKTIIIQPAQPQYLYVPVYNPTVIYGPWWAPAYRPWYWYPPPIWGYPPRPPNWGYASGFFWGAAWGITANNWGWAQPNWHGNSININVNNNNIWVNRPAYRNQYQNNGNWNHNVEHRRGVAYRDVNTGNKYRPTNAVGVQTRESYRGRDTNSFPAQGNGGNTARPATGTMDRPSSATGNNFTRPAPGTTERPSPGTAERPTSTSTGNVTRPSPQTMPTSRPASTGSRPAPAYQPESRPQVQRDANRGAQSRATMQSPAPSAQRSAPATQRQQAPSPSANRPAPSAQRSGGGGGGGNGGGQGRSR